MSPAQAAEILLRIARKEAPRSERREACKQVLRLFVWQSKRGGAR